MGASESPHNLSIPVPASIRCGGQTGVDRAALDVALRLGLPVFGWCPRGRIAEDGKIALYYPLRETPLADSRQRTRWNVRDSDGTLIVCPIEPVGGTALTLAVARQLNRPVLVVNPEQQPRHALNWLRAQDIDQLNVAGPRESECPGIYDRAARFLSLLLQV